MEENAPDLVGVAFVLGALVLTIVGMVFVLRRAARRRKASYAPAVASEPATSSLAEPDDDDVTATLPSIEDEYDADTQVREDTAVQALPHLGEENEGETTEVSEVTRVDEPPAMAEEQKTVDAAPAEEQPGPQEATPQTADYGSGLAKSRGHFLGKLGALFGGSSFDEAAYEELEEVLLTGDVGVPLTMRLVDELREAVGKGTVRDGAQAQGWMQDRLTDLLDGISVAGDPLTEPGEHQPTVILFVGVNGVGKTTTIGKIAHKLGRQGKKVQVVAGDTFRAAAAAQLQVWAERAEAEFFGGDEGADPASVIYKGLEAAKAAELDWVLADTAGRLHTKTDLMDEITKVKRACSKAHEGAPHKVWLVVDATTGQNAVQQATHFNEAVGLDGVVLTKLDGTAKGGVVAAIAEALKVPVVYIGVGETADDLQPFVAEAFVGALLGDEAGAPSA